MFSLEERFSSQVDSPEEDHSRGGDRSRALHTGQSLADNTATEVRHEPLNHSVLFQARPA